MFLNFTNVTKQAVTLLSAYGAVIEGLLTQEGPVRDVVLEQLRMYPGVFDVEGYLNPDPRLVGMTYTHQVVLEDGQRVLGTNVPDQHGIYLSNDMVEMLTTSQYREARDQFRKLYLFVVNETTERTFPA